jgi:hypothetical protein
MKNFSPGKQLISRLSSQTISVLDKVMRDLKLFLAFGVLILACANVFAQEPVAHMTKGDVEIFLAKDDGTGNVGEPATAFVTTDMPIHCVVQLGSAESVTVRMLLVAVAVPGVKPGTKVVATSYTTKDFQDRVSFAGSPQGQWVAGRYRVDIFVDDVKVAVREFAVQKSTQAKPANSKPDKSKLAGPVKKV